MLIKVNKRVVGEREVEKDQDLVKISTCTKRNRQNNLKETVRFQNSRKIKVIVKMSRNRMIQTKKQQQVISKPLCKNYYNISVLMKFKVIN